MNYENVVYPGRFQPMTLGHVACVKEILERHQPKKLVVVFPENISRSRDNPFLAKETQNIIGLSLNSKLPIEAIGINMGANLYELWERYLGRFRVDLVVSGNEKMVRLINGINFGKGVAVCFGDGSISQIRASDIREKITHGDAEWKKMLVPMAVEYIESLNIDWNGLPEKRKRWYQCETRVGVEPT